MRQLLVALIVQPSQASSLMLPATRWTTQISRSITKCRKATRGISRSECARTGFPVALLPPDGKLYVVTGDLTVNNNAALISHMGDAVTLTGDVTKEVVP